MIEEDGGVFAGVIKESEMMLGWSADQATEITTTAIDLEFLPTVTNVRSSMDCVAADACRHSWRRL